MTGKLKEFFLNVARGFGIGVAFIIPGFSGGTVAVILGVYDRLLSAVTGIFKQFKNSVVFLAPIAVGMILAFAALYFPIKFALAYIPLPILCMFVGLMLGGMPPVLKKAAGEKALLKKKLDTAGCIVCGALALCVAVFIGFLPANMLSPNLTVSMAAGDYAMLFLAGVLAAFALVVPGISGSMLLMVLGYYSAVMYGVIGNMGAAPGHNILVIAVLAAGIIAGFFIASFLMKFLLKKFPRGTYYAIIGFVLGSVVTLFYAGASGKFTLDGNTPLAFDYSAWQISLAVLLLLIGFAASFTFCYITSRRKQQMPDGNISEKKKIDID